VPANDSDPLGRHDWHSAEYVRRWIDRYNAGTGDLDAILSTLAVEPPARVLDVGAGYGRLTRVVLERFPRSRAVIQDFSVPMLARAAEYLVDVGEKYAAVNVDLRDPGWPRAVGANFDAVVSAIAIHNVRDPSLIAQIYRGVFECLLPGGRFVDVDLIEPEHGPEHLGWLREAGFDPLSARAEALDASRMLLFARRP
jgi:SAM-dependent methyltransferase